MKRTGEEITMNLPRSMHCAVEIAQAAADRGRFAHRLVEVLQVEHRGSLERGDELERGARVGRALRGRRRRRRRAGPR